jgi:phosphatidylglycerol:prolipoprotein diacylglycerol transferase
MVAIFWCFKRAKKLHLNTNRTLDICIVAMVSAFVGSRVFHVVFERRDYYLNQPSEILKFWNGGFVFYGGFFFALIASALYCRIKKISFGSYSDLFAPVISGLYAFGRMGCLAAGCCFGTPTTLPWGITFPYGVEAPPGIPLHPTQIYFSLWEGMVCLIILNVEKRMPSRKPGQLFGLWLILHAIGRGILEQFRGDFRGDVFFNLSLSTWLSLFALAIGLIIFTRARGQDASSAF